MNLIVFFGLKNDYSSIGSSFSWEDFLVDGTISPMIRPIAKVMNNKSALGKLRSQNQKWTTTISVFWRTKMISNTVSKMMMTIFVFIAICLPSSKPGLNGVWKHTLFSRQPVSFHRSRATTTTTQSALVHINGQNCGFSFCQLIGMIGIMEIQRCIMQSAEIH